MNTWSTAVPASSVTGLMLSTCEGHARTGTNIKLFRDITINEYESNGEIIVQEEFLVQDLNGYLLRFCMYK